MADDRAPEDAAAAAAASTTTRGPPLLFISHRHADSRIADVVREFIRSRSGGAVQVFQSSSAAAVGPRIGGNLNEQLVNALWGANIVILVYTTEDQDWAYCMWECGVALQPQAPYTRIIVFQCGTEFPAVFADRVRVNLRSSGDVQRFTNELLTSRDFFPRHDRPLTSFTPNDPSVLDAAESFHTELKKVLPPLDDAGIRSWHPYPFLRLELTVDQANAIGQAPTLESTRDVILDARIVDGDNEAARVFGMPDIPAGATLRRFVDNWKARYPGAEATWLDALAAQLVDAARWQFPTLQWALMRGVDRNDGTWYAPVVNRVRATGATQSTEFDVFFDKFELDETRHLRARVPPEGESADRGSG
jgi:hypothetical protein